MFHPTIHPTFPAILVFVSAFALLSVTQSATAQLNEKKVTRDASGVYKGKIKGGTVIYYPHEGDPISFPGPTNQGKVKVPVKKGNTGSKVKDGEIAGAGKAKASGRAKDPKVVRGGKAIKYLAKGSVDNTSTGFTLSGAKVKGTLKDQGAKWKALFKGGGIQSLPMNEAYLYSGRTLQGVN